MGLNIWSQRLSYLLEQKDKNIPNWSHGQDQNLWRAWQTKEKIFFLWKQLRSIGTQKEQKNIFNNLSRDEWSAGCLFESQQGFELWVAAVASQNLGRLCPCGEIYRNKRLKFALEWRGGSKAEERWIPG